MPLSLSPRWRHALLCMQCAAKRCLLCNTTANACLNCTNGYGFDRQKLCRKVRARCLQPCCGLWRSIQHAVYCCHTVLR